MLMILLVSNENDNEMKWRMSDNDDEVMMAGVIWWQTNRNDAQN